MAERPQGDPPTDSLTTLAEAEHDAALRRFEALRPHLQDGVALTEVATAANVPVRFCRSGLSPNRAHGAGRVTHTKQSPEFPGRFTRWKWCGGGVGLRV